MTRSTARPKAVLAAVLTFALGILGLAGCSDAPAATGDLVALAVVVSPHANAPKPTIVESLKTALADAVAHHGYVTIVINDGNPTLVKGGGATVGSHAKTKRMAEQANAEQVDAIGSLIESQRATTAQSAPLQALSLAARDLASRPGSKRIVIQDSGLQTVAPISFTTEGQLGSEPAEVADFLAKEKELPDLAGVAVTWTGLGDTAAPQQPLDQASRANLQAIWRAVIERAGGTVTFDASPLTDAPESGLPIVSTVPVPTPVQIPVNCTPKEVFLRNSDVRFNGDLATYADESAARRILEPLARRIVSEGLSVHIIGTTASSNRKAFIARLSRDRADAVAATLRELGVPGSAISAEGQGMDDQWHVADRDANGNLVPALAASNRKVVLVLSGTTGC